MNTTFEFDTSSEAIQFMKSVARTLHDSEQLAYGVGNDMSYPFYTYRTGSQIDFHPNGIKVTILQLHKRGAGAF